MIPTYTYNYVLSINGGYFILQGDIPSLEVKELRVDVKRVKVLQCRNTALKFVHI